MDLENRKTPSSLAVGAAQPYTRGPTADAVGMSASADAAISSIRYSARPSPHGIRRAVTRPIRTSHLGSVVSS